MLDAFFTLSPSRQQGFGPGGILLSEMATYCQIYDVPNVPRFVRFIQALDGAFLAYKAEEMKRAT